MKRVAQFQKVSFAQFWKDSELHLPHISKSQAEEMYENICLPERKTSGSAGYDFHAPFAFSLSPRQGIVIPTGVRVQIEEGWFLGILPRSGQSFRYRIQLDNTMGVIDADYFYAENEGHIIIKLSNDSMEEKTMDLEQKIAFAQGIFFHHGITMDDNVSAKRMGGFGSTG